MQRSEASGPGWEERFVNIAVASKTSSLSCAVAQSLSYVVFSGFATIDECSILIDSATKLQDIFLKDGDNGEIFKGITVKWVTECSRFSVSELLNKESGRISKLFLKRMLHRLEFGLDGKLDPELSDVAIELFGESHNLQNLHVQWYDEMSYDRVSNPEPMVNVYQEGGFFKRHSDMMQMTLLIVLVDATEGGGTAFFADEGADRLPDRVEQPPAGTAMIWSGKLFHAALPVAEGTRIVYVGSFNLVQGLS